MHDFFNAPQPSIGELIPTGTPLWLEMTFTAGGHGEHGLLTRSKPSAGKPNPDTAYLKAEFTVLRGPYKNRKFWSNLALEGGELNEQGHSKAATISYQTIRKIIYSAHGLKSDDMTPNAKAICEKYGDLRALNGIRFVARAAVSKPQDGYAQKNELGGHWNIMTVDSKRWPSEHELDNPPAQGGKPGAPTSAAPVWKSPTSAAAPAVTQTAAAPAAFPPPTASAPVDNGLPKWMNPAA